MSQGAAPFTAGASATGYLYQCRYALRLLLERLNLNDMGAELSVEKFDDISFDHNNAPVEMIQTKHRHNAAPDLTDSSPDLWKTIRVWAEGLKAGRFNLPQTSLVIVTTATCAAGSAAEYLRHGNGRDAKKALKLIIAARKGMAGATLEPARKAFAALNRAEQLLLVNAITVVDASPDINATTSAIRTALGRPVHSDHMAAFIERLEGWWLGQLIVRLSGAVDAPVTATQLDAHIDELRETFRLDALPIDYASGPPPDVGFPIDDSSRFVRQLALIGLLRQRLTQAITDYQRAYAQRSRWLRDNLLMAKQLDAYDDQLVGDWLWRFQTMEQDTDGVTETTALERTGRSMYEALLATPRTIRTNCTEAYVGRGSYHCLADLPRPRVGWHRDYLTRIT
ncbi:MAG: ABC-three component system protein [Gemmataceae bacterium]